MTLDTFHSIKTRSTHLVSWAAGRSCRSRTYNCPPAPPWLLLSSFGSPRRHEFLLEVSSEGTSVVSEPFFFFLGSSAAIGTWLLLLGFTSIIISSLKKAMLVRSGVAVLFQMKQNKRMGWFQKNSHVNDIPAAELGWVGGCFVCCLLL